MMCSMQRGRGTQPDVGLRSKSAPPAQVIYCTGYKYHYPFLEELGIVTTGAAYGMHASTSR